MSQKRSSKPIRITLTEDQISDIIQSAAKTRRSLSAQSLEDRIAPSAIGAPMFDPGMGDPSNPPLPNFDPNNPAPPMDPNAGLLPGDPPAPPGFIDPSHSNPTGMDTPPLPGGDPLLPGQPAGFDPTGGALPPNPPSLAGIDPNFDAVQHHNMLHGTVQGQGFAHQPAVDPSVTPEGDASPSPEVPATLPPTTPGTPTPQEFEEHRRNILRQLRGI